MSDSSSECIFCSIISGKVPADMVYQDERVVAFHDARPVAPVHILIVPRTHIPTLNDIQPHDDILAHVGQVARKIAEKFGVDQKGYRFFINVNRGGGQVVFHLHAHVVSKSI
jgi:histidine triad (HIT) family protein